MWQNPGQHYGEKGMSERAGTHVHESGEHEVGGGGDVAFNFRHGLDTGGNWLVGCLIAFESDINQISPHSKNLCMVMVM